MALPPNCAACSAFQHDGELCRRHAPGPSTEKHEVTKWPQRDSDSRCAQGLVDKPRLACRDCLYWWQPNGQPLSPRLVGAGGRSGIWAPPDPSKTEAWWKESGLCVSSTAGPSDRTERYHPRVTHGFLDYCFSGKAIDDEAGEEGQATLLIEGPL